MTPVFTSATASFNPPPFQVTMMLCRSHFQLKKGVIQQQMQDWLSVADKTTSKPMKEAVAAIKTEFEKLQH